MKIDALPLFSETSENFRKEMDKFLRWKTFQTGQEILNREDQNSDILFVHKGKVRIVIYTLSGREVTLDDIEAGGFFGEMAAIDKEPRSASVVALEPSEIAFLSAEKFEEGYGLKNVHNRVRLTYGEEYGVKIESVFGKGTRVLVYIPIIY